MPASVYENHEPTVWEQKLRDYRLSNETPEVRAWREEAEDPNTTGERLAQIADAIRRLQKGNEGNVNEAIARHPNAPPALLVFLIAKAECDAAFCQNPIAPFVLLEMPDFIARLAGVGDLLREESVPLLLLNAIAAHYSIGAKEAEKEARLHVAIAGEVATTAEGEAQITAFWREHLLLQAARLTPPGEDRQKHRGKWEQLNRYLQTNGDLVELGLAPAWADLPQIATEPRISEALKPGRRLLRGTIQPSSRKEQRVWANLAPFLADRPELATLARRNASADELALLVDLIEEHSEKLWQTFSLAVLIAAHPQVSSPLLERLIGLFDAPKGRYPSIFSPHDDIECLTACNPNASTELVAQLAQHPHAEVRRLARRHKNAPADVLDISRQAVLERWSDENKAVETFERFISGLYCELGMKTVFYCGTSGMASRRLTAALALPVAPISLCEGSGWEAAKAACTTCDLLEHLARDGNRLVRWAAQTRLAEPDYKFTWR